MRDIAEDNEHATGITPLPATHIDYAITIYFIYISDDDADEEFFAEEVYATPHIHTSPPPETTEKLAKHKKECHTHKTLQASSFPLPPEFSA